MKLRRGYAGRRGNPYHNAKVESFMKTLKVEAVNLGDYEIMTDVVADLPQRSEPNRVRGSKVTVHS